MRRNLPSVLRFPSSVVVGLTTKDCGGTSTKKTFQLKRVADGLILQSCPRFPPVVLPISRQFYLPPAIRGQRRFLKKTVTAFNMSIDFQYCFVVIFRNKLYFLYLTWRFPSLFESSSPLLFLFFQFLSPLGFWPGGKARLLDR